MKSMAIRRLGLVILIIGIFFVTQTSGPAQAQSRSHLVPKALAGLSGKKLLEQGLATAIKSGRPMLVFPKHSNTDSDLLVQFRSSRLSMKTALGQSLAKSFASRHYLTITGQAASGNILQIRSGSVLPSTLIWQLQRDPDVARVQPNYQYHTLTSDPDFSLQWGLNNTGQTINFDSSKNDADIDAPAAWSVTEGDSSVIVADIDTGVALEHPDLAANLWDGTSCVDDLGNALGGCNHGYDFADDDVSPEEFYISHGTVVAGVISAEHDNDLGIAGVAPHAQFMALKSNLTTVEVVRAIHFAEQNGAKVINASWGSSFNDGILEDAISSFNGLFVASAGNSALDHDNGFDALYPCDFTAANIVCVAATDQHDELAYFSDYGPTSVDLGAPGENIFSSLATDNLSFNDYTGIADGDIPAGFTRGGSNNNWGVVGESILVTDTNNLPYAENVDTTLTTAPTDLSQESGAYMGLIAVCDTEYSDAYNDYLAIEMSHAPKYNAGTFDTVWGTSGSGDNQFSGAQDIAVGPDGSVFVADTNNDRIEKFQADGTFVDSWGSTGTGNGQFDGPTGLTVDGSGTVYVADTGNSRIQKFTSNGVFVSKFGSAGTGNGEFSLPRDVAVDAAGSIYVLDTSNNRVEKFLSDESFELKWGSLGNAVDQFTNPYSIAVDTSGYVYVLDTGNNRVSIFTEDGDELTVFGINGSGPGQFSSATGLAIGPDRTIIVANGGNNRVDVFRPIFYSFLPDLAYSLGSSGTNPDQFDTVRAVAVGADGKVYTIDSALDRAQRVSPTATTTPSTPTEIMRFGEKQFDDDSDSSTPSSMLLYLPIPQSALTNDFQLRFHWVTDNNGNTGTEGDGCAIDTAVISLSNGADNNYDYEDGTSFSAPHVAGAAALIWSYRPDISVAQMKQVLVNSGDSLTGLNGLTVSGKRLNLYKALRYFTLTTLGGKPANPTTSTTASMTVSGFDLTYYKYSLDGGAYSSAQAAGTPLTLSGLTNGTHTIRVIGRDSVAHWQPTNEATTYSWKVDLVSPTATVTYSKTKMTDGPVVATIHPSESVTMTNNSGRLSRSFTANGSYTFTFRDAVGHTGSVTAQVKNIIAPLMIAGVNHGNIPIVRTINPVTRAVLNEFLVFDRSDHNGVRVALGNVTGDAQPELIVATSPGSDPKVKILKKDGTKLLEFNPYPTSHGIGVSVASGDVNGDGVDEIITVPASNAPAQVRVFRYRTSPARVEAISQGFAYPSTARNGFEVAAGDIDGNGKDEIVVTAAREAKTLGVFSATSSSLTLLSKFSPYNFTFASGMRISVGDFSGDGKGEILTTPGPGYYTDIKGFTLHGTLVNHFLPSPKSVTYGFNLASVDLNHDHREEVLIIPASNATPVLAPFFYNKTLGTFSLGTRMNVFPLSITQGVRIDAVPHP